MAGISKSGWPVPEQWAAFIRFMLLFYMLFFPAYFGAGYLTDGSARAKDLFLPIETGIPLIPWMIVPYLSLFVLFLLPLVQMTPRQMQGLSRQSSAALIVGGLVFIVLPGRLGFPPQTGTGWWAPAFDVIAALDTKHNLVPSLHVTFAALILFGCAERAPAALRWLYRSWFALMSASTVLVHQHHLIDVAGGLALALLVRRLWPLQTPLKPATA
jgi:membrane-associated phospholipid phosphatase